MGASGYRWSGYLGLALTLVAAACGGAAPTSLDDPPSTAKVEAGVHPTHDGGSSSSSGGSDDATVDTNPGGDTGDDAALEASGDDGGGGQPGDEGGGGEAGGMCGSCSFGMTCCTKPNAVSFGQCYSVLCGALCCP